MSRFQALLSGWVFGMLLTFVVVMIWRGLFIIINGYEGAGIYMSPDNEAVYIDGEACTVNYSPDPPTMRSRMEWCHQEYLKH